MQTINFACPHCGNLMAVGPALLGRSVRCPHCQNVLRAPATVEAAAATLNPAAASVPMMPPPPPTQPTLPQQPFFPQQSAYPSAPAPMPSPQQSFFPPVQQPAPPPPIPASPPPPPPLPESPAVMPYSPPPVNPVVPPPASPPAPAANTNPFDFLQKQPNSPLLPTASSPPAPPQSPVVPLPDPFPELNSTRRDEHESIFGEAGDDDLFGGSAPKPLLPTNEDLVPKRINPLGIPDAPLPPVAPVETGRMSAAFPNSPLMPVAPPPAAPPEIPGLQPTALNMPNLNMFLPQAPPPQAPQPIPTPMTNPFAFAPQAPAPAPQYAPAPQQAAPQFAPYAPPPPPVPPPPAAPQYPPAAPPNPWADPAAANPFASSAPQPSPAPAPAPESEPSSEGRAAKPIKVKAPPVQAGGAPIWLVAAFGIWALLATAGAIYFAATGKDPPDPITRIPDFFGEFEKAQRKKVSTLSDWLGKPAFASIVPKVDAPLPPGHRLKLGETRAFGDLEVTPIGVELQPVVYGTLGEESPKPQRSGNWLALSLKLKNLAKDYAFHPTDPAFNRRVSRGKDDEKSYPYTRLEFGSKTYFGPFLWPDSKVLIGPKQEKDNVPLGPGEEREYVIYSEPALDFLKVLRSAKEAGAWRVQLRRGLEPTKSEAVPEISVTTVVAVLFDPAEVKQSAPAKK